MKQECCEKNPFVAIPASMAGMFLVVVILFLIFAKESIALLIPLSWAFVVLAIVGMALVQKTMMKKK